MKAAAKEDVGTEIVATILHSGDWAVVKLDPIEIRYFAQAGIGCHFERSLKRSSNALAARWIIVECLPAVPASSFGDSLGDMES
jgi:hypothetical protein